MAKKSVPPKIKILQIPGIPDQESVEDFLKEVTRKARQVWRSAHPQPTKKGGRPSIEDKVFACCNEIWKEWGEKFPDRQPYQADLLRMVIERMGYADPVAAEKNTTLIGHVGKWIECAIPWIDAPRRWRVQHVGNIQTVLGWMSILLGYHKYKIIFNHMTDEQKHATLADTNWVELITPDNQSSIEAKWRESPEIQHYENNIRLLKAVADDPETLAKWKKQLAPLLADQLSQLRQSTRSTNLHRTS